MMGQDRINFSSKDFRADGIIRVKREEEGYHFAAIGEVVADEDAKRACLCPSPAGLGTMAPALALDTRSSCASNNLGLQADCGREIGHLAGRAGIETIRMGRSGGASRAGGILHTQSPAADQAR
jgi:hypothetical protein